MSPLCAPELPGLAAGEAREVWGGEESPALRGEAVPVRPGEVVVRRGDHIVLAPPCLGLGCHGGGKGEERGLQIAAAGLVAGRTYCISHALVFHSFILSAQCARLRECERVHVHLF